MAFLRARSKGEKRTSMNENIGWPASVRGTAAYRMRSASLNAPQPEYSGIKYAHRIFCLFCAHRNAVAE